MWREAASIVNDFINRHAMTFTDLELSSYNGYTSGDDVIEICGMFPKCLTSFRFDHISGITDENIKRLTLDPLNPAEDLAPDLSYITLSASMSLYTTGLSSAVVVEMILSRWARNPRTKFELSIVCEGIDPRLDPRIIKHLQQNPGLLDMDEEGTFYFSNSSYA